eukprot:CAMPEP_0183746478 /NCGR_PEP_ID=MMETSP0737-20130205/66776_1 /TAXON_ID=385413 /ORGANISM="Thalassiosira miniscula, Strain CCMP1093" /LENGTH=580 /DNA_ID=CAMNT_0025982173 /DNA_START=128 /DNA_END=1870 /DNA_ORIENTATION=-
MTETRGRTGFASKFRNRSASIGGSQNERIQQGRPQDYEDGPVLPSTRKTSSFVARLRSRSASRSRINRHMQPQQCHEEVPSYYPGNEPTSAEIIEEAVNRHQMALKMDMIEIVQNHEKEMKFWKNKALRLKKKMSESLSRSASRSRINRHMQPQQCHEEVPSYYPGNEPTSAEIIEEAVNRHQMALKMDMIEIVQNHEKEMKFWKNKALRLKKKMSESLMEQDLSNKTVPSSDDDGRDMDVKLLMEKVSALEKGVQQREVVIDSQRQTMEIQEKASEERVRLLEDQLERLVEMTVKAASSTGISFVSSTRPMSDFDHVTPLDVGKSHGNDPTYEVSILETLLARVLAEKDKLMFENQNLRTVLKETGSSVAVSDTVDEIYPENIQHQEEQFMNIGNNPENIQHQEEQFMDIGNNDHRESERVDINQKTNPPDERYTENVQKQEEQFMGIGNNGHNESEHVDEQYEYYRVLYKISCRNCQQNHSHINYMGSCTGKWALKDVLNQHFCQVCEIVQEQNGKSISSSVCSDELKMRESDVNQFLSSSLGRHLAKHCQTFSNEKDVIKWCHDNVKVEVQQFRDEC